MYILKDQSGKYLMKIDSQIGQTIMQFTDLRINAMTFITIREAAKFKKIYDLFDCQIEVY